MQDNISQKIVNYIINELLSGVDEIDDNSSLFSTRVISSLNLMRLVDFIEEEFSIKVQPMELIIENFDTISRITDFIHRKQVV